MPIDKKTIDHIEMMVKGLVDNISVDFFEGDYMRRSRLKIINEKGNRFDIYFPWELVDDFNQAVLNYHNTPYFYSSDNRLKYEICSELVEMKISPKMYVSDEMIREKGEWYGPELSNSFVLRLDEKMTLAIADGLKLLLNSF